MSSEYLKQNYKLIDGKFTSDNLIDTYIINKYI